MFLLFGNLVQSFISFGTAVIQQTSNTTDSSAQAVQDAAKSFWHEASKDALILVLVGISES
jgi:hypothetical protein